MLAINLFLCIAVIVSTECAELKISTNVKDVRYYLYTNKQAKVELKLGNKNSFAGVRPNTNTYIIIGGFQSNGESALSLETKTAILASKPKSNVIIVDWGKLSGHGISLKTFAQTKEAYSKAVANISPIANVAAKLLRQLHKEKNISYKQMHIIGFSLGAHMAGAVGFQTKAQNSAEVGRITGLDPAGPGFSDQVNMKYRLDKTDAKFVEIYHTNKETLGDKARHTAHINVFVNGGETQKRCEKQDQIPGQKGSCSHLFAVKLWNYCIKHECEVCPCSGKDCKCPDCNLRCSKKIPVGLNGDTNASGELYFGQGSTKVG